MKREHRNIEKQRNFSAELKFRRVHTNCLFLTKSACYKNKNIDAQMLYTHHVPSWRIRYTQHTVYILKHFAHKIRFVYHVDFCNSVFLYFHSLIQLPVSCLSVQLHFDSISRRSCGFWCVRFVECYSVGMEYI